MTLCTELISFFNFLPTKGCKCYQFIRRFLVIILCSMVSIFPGVMPSKVKNNIMFSGFPNPLRGHFFQVITHTHVRRFPVIILCSMVSIFPGVMPSKVKNNIMFSGFPNPLRGHFFQVITHTHVRATHTHKRTHTHTHPHTRIQRYINRYRHEHN